MEKGSLTVEAAIVVPIAIITVIVLVYMAVLWVHHSNLTSLSHRAAEFCAAAWNSIGKDIDTGRVEKSSLGKDNLYRRLWDPEKQNRINKAKEYIMQNAGNYRIIKPVDVKADVRVKDYIIYKTIEVSIENAYKIPASGFFKIFGINEHYVIHARSESIIKDTEEFIRNTDFIIDIERELEARNLELKKLGDRARQTLEDIKRKAGELLVN
jgi:hypothetical protein